MRTCVVTHRHFKDAAIENNRRRTNIDFSLPDFWKLQRDWSIQRSPEDERLRTTLISRFMFVIVISARLCFSYTVLLDKEAEEFLYETAIDRQIDEWGELPVIDERAMSSSPLMPSEVKGLYKTLRKHPVLMNRRLQVGETKPPLYPPFIDYTIKTEKRSMFDFGLAQPACPTKTEWKLLFTAKDMNNTTVEVFQPTDKSNRFQWFYIVSCDFERLTREAVVKNFEIAASCRGIDRQRFSSVCVPQKSYVMALVRKSPDVNFDWDYIQVETSCNCAVTPLPHL